MRWRCRDRPRPVPGWRGRPGSAPLRHCAPSDSAAIVVALAAALVGSALLAAGRPGVTEPTLVAPFAGLPPVDAVPSTPESGALVVSYLGPLSARSIGDLPIDVGLRPGGWHQVVPVR